MEKDYLDTAVQAARAAGHIQRERLWGDNSIDFKGENNLVTEVDRLSEDVILRILRAACPACDILLKKVVLLARASLRWIVDPLDGTTNYAHGFPWFAVSIALEVSGEIHLGVVYHPMMDELFTCVRGRGAWLNGRKISVSRRQPLKSACWQPDFPMTGIANENNFNNFVQFQLAARAVRRAGAAALDLAYVAAGRLDGFWECKLKPWDVAAGKLLVEEAGGTVTNHARRTVFHRRSPNPCQQWTCPSGNGANTRLQ